ncbi:hypothetical protein Taro_046676 [Colocasia esculenta]|uniref:Pentatricopeptide repeat-containing protein n=1 Tax=Colocasia esculenta TaxID=4460 RepID=A0A843WT32_COLES|nr:hypothetical protein [Colocasia esculenta]
MDSVLAASLGPRFSQLGLAGRPRSGDLLPKAGCAPPQVRCGLRGAGSRPQLWRGRVPSSEAIQAVQALKRAKTATSSPATATSKLDDVFASRVARLLKADLVAVLAELQRQNEWEIALRVFQFIREEVWYKPDLSLYSDMIFMMGKNRLIGIAEELFSELREEGLQPDTRAYTEMIGAFLQVDRVEKAMGMYKLMKESGLTPSELTFTILIRNLEKAGQEDFASTVRKDCAEFMDYPERFLKELDRKYVMTSQRLFPETVHSASSTIIHSWKSIRPVGPSPPFKGLGQLLFNHASPDASKALEHVSPNTSGAGDVELLPGGTKQGRATEHRLLGR